MTEGHGTLELMLKYYGSIENGRIVRYGAQIPFNFLLLTNTNMGTKPYEYKTIIENWLKNMPIGNKIHANWVVGFQFIERDRKHRYYYMFYMLF